MTCTTTQLCRTLFELPSSRSHARTARGEYVIPWELPGRRANRSPGIMMSGHRPNPVRPSISTERLQALSRNPWRWSEVQADLALLVDEIAMRIFALFGRPDVALRRAGKWIIHLDRMSVDVERLIEIYREDPGASNSVEHRKALERKLLSDGILLAGLSGSLTIERLRAMAMKMSPAILTLLGESEEPPDFVVTFARSMAKEGLLLANSTGSASLYDLEPGAKRRALCNVRPLWRSAVID